jgi:GT2 family glycosyltransferase
VLNEDKFLPGEYNETFHIGKIPGITFSPELATRIRFRDDLVIDQVDIDFGRQVRRSGGKIIYYPEFVISRLPIGRENGKGIHTLPYWRFYLYVRNVFLLALEERAVLSSMKQLTSAVSGTTHWFYIGIKSGQKVGKLVKTLKLGITDAALKRSGITRNLQILSGNRFSSSKSMRTSSSPEISDSNS